MRECKCQSAWGPGVRELEEALPCRKAAPEVPSGAVSWGDSSPLNYDRSVEGISHIRFCPWTWLFLHKEVIPSPSAYRLMSKDDKDLEMCLITDYSPENITFYSAEKPTSAIVEVATAENSVESSYLSTYWARRDEMQCGAHHEGFGDQEGKDPESGASTVCVTGLSPHFRTDEHLNTLSLSQLGLKIILMKGIIFNVLMTMLLWGKKD